MQELEHGRGREGVMKDVFFMSVSILFCFRLNVVCAHITEIIPSHAGGITSEELLAISQDHCIKQSTHLHLWSSGYDVSLTR